MFKCTSGSNKPAKQVKIKSKTEKVLKKFCADMFNLCELFT